MSNTVDVDFPEIEALFSVIEKCVQHSGKFTGIMAAANSRLQEINDELREAQIDAKAEAEAEAEREAAATRPRAIPAEGDEDVDGDGDPIESVEPTKPDQVRPALATAPIRRT